MIAQTSFHGYTPLTLRARSWRRCGLALLSLRIETIKADSGRACPLKPSFQAKFRVWLHSTTGIFRELTWNAHKSGEGKSRSKRFFGDFFSGLVKREFCFLSLVKTTNFQLLNSNYQLSEKIDRPKTVNFPYDFENSVQ